MLLYQSISKPNTPILQCKLLSQQLFPFRSPVKSELKFYFCLFILLPTAPVRMSNQMAFRKDSQERPGVIPHTEFKSYKSSAAVC